MYCPKCLNETLTMNGKGVAEIIINKKQMDSGRILFNMQTQTNRELKEVIYKKIKEFLRWYSSFQNVETIHSVELVSNSFICTNRCSINVNKKFSVIDFLISETDLMEILEDLAVSHNFVLSLR